MTLDKFVTFVYETDDRYDPVESKTIYGDKKRINVPCNVGDLTIKETKEVFGELDTGALKIRLISPFYHDYSYVEYEGSRYTVVASRRGKIFYLKELINGKK